MARRGSLNWPGPPPVSVAVVLAFALLASLLFADAVSAQSAVQAAIERRGPVSAEKRAELYRQLEQQAAILEAQAAVVKTVAKLVGPTVVHIESDVTGRSALQYGRGQRVEEAGSGVIIQWKEKHFVLTNRHVVTGAAPEKINVHLADGRLLHPTRVWENEDTDVAVLAISAPDLVAAPLGNSDALEIGDPVLAVGSPFGLSFSVTSGIISAKGRRGLEFGKDRPGLRLQDFIQTDAAINPGNSGGPLINLRGEVIGISTAIASNSGGSEGIGFAIPVNMFMTVARQLIEHGRVRWGFLGVTLDRDFGPAKATEIGLPGLFGARVIQVTADSPATAAKLQAEDVILQIDGVPIEDDDHLVNVVNLTEPGTEISLVIFRDRKQWSLKTVVGSREQFD